MRGSRETRQRGRCLEHSHRLLSRRSLHLHRQDLPATISATVGADVVREPRLATLRADFELRQFDAMVLTAVALTVVGDTFLRKCAHGMLLSLLLWRRASPRVSPRQRHAGQWVVGQWVDRQIGNGSIDRTRA